LYGAGAGRPGVNGEPLLSVQNLTVDFATRHGRLRAVDGLSLDIHPGEIVALVGESGSGKTVTGLTMLGLSRGPNVTIGGQILFGGRDLVGLSDEELRKLRGNELAMIFQDPLSSLNPVRTIGSQIAHSVRFHLGVSRAGADERAVELLNDVGIPHPRAALHAYPHEFSGGMRQRAMIALALAAGPKLLVADEPTTALDVTIQAQIIALIERLAREQSLGVLFVSHDLAVVEDTTDRSVVMYAASVMERGPSADLFERPLHPYTWSLTRAVPRTTGPRLARLQAIEGAPPSLIAPPSGCRFRTRCPVAFERCVEPPPERRRDGGDRVFLCWHEEPEAHLAALAPKVAARA